MKDVTVEKIKSRIRENLKKAKEQNPDKEVIVSSETIKPVSAPVITPIAKADAAKKNSNELLWQYGTRYSKIIKSIPILRGIAEKYYWKLAYSHTYMPDKKVSWHLDNKGVDFMENDWHYHRKLQEIKKEGLKGKIKLFIFKFIGFFATWQEQINNALYQGLANLRAEITERDKSIESINKSLNTIKDAIYQDLTNLRAEITERDKSIESINKSLNTIKDALYQDLTNLRAEITEKDKAIDSISKTLSTISRTEDALYQDLTNLRAEITERDKHNLEALRAEITEKDKAIDRKNEDLQYRLNQSMNPLLFEVNDLKEIMSKKFEIINDLNRHLNFVGRKVELLNYELKKRAEIDVNKAIKEIANKDFSAESYAYFSFENTFRGSRGIIKTRQSQYLNYVIEAHAKSQGSYLLDIGCGRGEFIEILSENNIPAKGIDINEENIDICKELGLNADLADALNFLKSVKNNSLIGITAFQVVEHLNTEYLIELIKVSFQKIKEGGTIIFETVNPYSLYSLRNFYIDLTHRNPIPPDTLKFLTEASGFMNVEVQFSSPVPDEIRLKEDNENTRKLNEILFGYQDYAIVGRK